MRGKGELHAVLAGLALLVIPCLAHADLNVVKEVVIAPKTVNAAANIGSVNSSSNVRMTRARVDIRVGEPWMPSHGSGALSPIPLIVRATFELLNESTDALQLTVGFPVSNSEFSSFRLEWFRAESDGEPREVFRRVSSYPRQLVQEYVSGVLGPETATPPTDVDREAMQLMGSQSIGGERFQNLMVWEERFAAGQRKTIKVDYELQIPLQQKTVTRKRVKGNYKGTWPHEANNVPSWFLSRLPDKSYYFFDYYLTTGASWAGAIGEESIVLHFGPWWRKHEFHTSAAGKFAVTDGEKTGPNAPIVYHYTLRNEEPKENLYFAIRPAGRP